MCPAMPRRSTAGLLAAGLLAPCLLAALFLAAPARAQDAADFVVRMNRLEGQTRQMSGQIEQLQFENRQLKDQLRKFQEDVEFRLQERGGRAAPAQRAPTATPPTATPPARRGDAFDPGQNPGAPGAPRQLGSSQPLPPQAAIPARPLAIEDDEEGGLPPPGLGAPVDLTPPARIGSAQPQGFPAAVSGMNPSANAGTTPPSVAAGGSSDSRTDYDGAYASLLARQYERAEMGFRGFIQAHPRDRLVADATYWLGETYLQRNRPREAAEQFLKVTTDYSRSTKAPDAMLKLGMSLGAIGAKDQACATFAELERKFPSAAPAVRQGVDREQKRARCA